MGCCILGAIIYALLMRSWRFVRGLFGFASAADERPNAAMWRLNGAAPVQNAVRADLPLRYRRAVGACMAPLALYTAYSLHVPRLMIQFALVSGLPVAGLLPYCN
jgi:hypothetical protein